MSEALGALMLVAIIGVAWLMLWFAFREVRDLDRIDDPPEVIDLTRWLDRENRR